MEDKSPYIWSRPKSLDCRVKPDNDNEKTVCHSRPDRESRRRISDIYFGQPQFPVITIISLITTTYSAIPRLEIIVVDAKQRISTMRFWQRCQLCPNILVKIWRLLNEIRLQFRFIQPGRPLRRITAHFLGRLWRAELAIMGSHCRHIELITKQSYVDEIKWTPRNIIWACFAIHADVGFGPGEDKIKSMQTCSTWRQKSGFLLWPCAPKGNPMTKPRPKKNLNICAEWVKRRPAAHHLAIKTACRRLRLQYRHDGANDDRTRYPRPGREPGHTAYLPAREDATDTIKKLGKKIVHVHLREYPDVEDRQHYECKAEEEIAGRGGVNFPRF